MDQRHLGQPDIGVSSSDGVALAAMARHSGIRNRVAMEFLDSANLSGSRARQVLIARMVNRHCDVSGIPSPQAKAHLQAISKSASVLTLSTVEQGDP